MDKTSVIFGDGAHGVIPAARAEVSVEYLETLGTRGNIGRGLVTEMLSPITRGGIVVPLDVTNTIPATGGADRESMDRARVQAPAELTTLWKAVTKADYQALAEGFPGVAKAQVLDVNDCCNIRYYQVNIAVAPNGGGLPSPLLMGELQAFLESRKVITIEINLFDPAYRPIALDAEVFGFAGEDLALLRSRAEAALREFLSFDRVSFGMAVYYSDLVALLDGVPGVSHVRLREPGTDIILRPGEIPQLGALYLVMKRAT
jgi:predicted phage baseplate assembly protein